MFATCSLFAAIMWSDLRIVMSVEMDQLFQSCVNRWTKPVFAYATCQKGYENRPGTISTVSSCLIKTYSDHFMGEISSFYTTHN